MRGRLWIATCYHESLSARLLIAAACLSAAAVFTAQPLARTPGQTPAPISGYTVIGLDTRKLLSVRTIGNADLVPLDQVTAIFSVTANEDRATGGLTITAKNTRVVLTSGQSIVSVSGKLLSLSGPVTREAGAWLVPVDLLSRVLGPALGLKIDIRRASRIIAVGAVALPQITTRIERTLTGGRVVIDSDTPVTHKISRNGNHVVIAFEAAAIDAPPPNGAAPEFVTGVHVDGASLIVDLGPSAASVRTNDDRARVTIEMASPAPAAPAVLPPPPAPSAPTQTIAPDLISSGGLRTVVLDPGHGGDDPGVHGPGGTLEKDVVLQIARRAKAAIESRLSLRVLLTREGDDNVPADKRTAFANNQRGDVFISLHANASLRPGLRGAEVLSLSLDEYKTRANGIGAGDRVPVVGGTQRVIQAVPWELAQMPFVGRSSTFATSLLRHLAEQNVAVFNRAPEPAPLVGLAGVNMPAVLIEAGFLSNPDDERGLTGDLANAVVEAIIAALAELRSAGTAPGPPLPRTR
jgi:N-acetylmuramoyl-L-alanine amidase